MKKFVFEIVWSQTDKDSYLVYATSKTDALAKVKARFPNAFFHNFQCEIYGEVQ